MRNRQMKTSELLKLSLIKVAWKRNLPNKYKKLKSKKTNVNEILKIDEEELPLNFGQNFINHDIID